MISSAPNSLTASLLGDTVPPVSKPVCPFPGSPRKTGFFFNDCGTPLAAGGTESRHGYAFLSVAAREKPHARRLATGPQSPLFALIAVLTIPALVVLIGFIGSRL